ncbi:hypothetical protein RQP46_006238 [Phenoliferia psychrophenolica]
MQTLRRIDVVGALLLIGGIAMFLCALQLGGYSAPWKSAKCSGLLLVACYPLWARWHPNPIIPRVLFSENRRVVLLSLAIIFVCGMNFYSALSFFPLIAEAVFATTPVLTGLRTLGFTAAVVHVRRLPEA